MPSSTAYSSRAARGRRRALVAVIPAVVFAVTMTGCARYYWSKPGAGATQFDRDNTECARQTSANPTEAAHGMVDMPRYRACLEARQWVRKKEIDPPPPGSYRGFE